MYLSGLSRFIQVERIFSCYMFRVQWLAPLHQFTYFTIYLFIYSFLMSDILQSYSTFDQYREIRTLTADDVIHHRPILAEPRYIWHESYQYYMLCSAHCLTYSIGYIAFGVRFTQEIACHFIDSLLHSFIIKNSDNSWDSTRSQIRSWNLNWYIIVRDWKFISGVLKAADKVLAWITK
jgi:hypothetical protein